MPHQVSIIFLVAGLLCLPAHATAHPKVDIDELTRTYPALHRGLLKYGHHLRHSSHPPKHALLKYRHNVDLRDGASLDAELEADLEAAPLALPGRHPAVEKALDGMAGDLENLNEKKLAAKEARGELESRVSGAVHHMNDAMAIKHSIAEKEAQLRVQGGKLQALENDAARLHETRENLMSSLRQMLEPKLVIAQHRFQKKERVLQKEEKAAKAWKGKKDQLKASAMELIKQKKASYQSLLQAEAEVAQAKKKADMARIQYEHDGASTAEQVQSYRYAETRYKAEAQHAEAAKAATLAARDSVQKLYNVESMEQQKVDQSVMVRKERLRRKIQGVEMEREKSTHDLSDLSQQYRQWQEQQRERSVEVVKKSEETAAASVAYADRQQQVLDSASAKVARAAEGANDWDGWGNDFSKVSDEDDD